MTEQVNQTVEKADKESMGNQDSEAIEKIDPESAQSGPPGTKRQRLRSHCGRRWWVWLAGFLVFAVVIIIIVIYGIIPAAAQKALDNTILNVKSISILQPGPSQYQFSVVSYITGSSSLAHKATLDPMDVEFNLKGQDSFMSLPLPGVHGGDNVLVETLNYTTQIANAALLSSFAGTLMSSKEFEMGIQGHTKIHLGSISTKAKYREWVTLKGFNNLEGMAIVKYGTASGDYGVAGKVVIPNPTVFTLQLGDVYLNIGLNNEHLGNGILPELIISPGMKNTYDFKANFTLDNTLKLAKAVFAGNATLQITVSKVEYNGASIPWLSAPMGLVSVDTPIDTNYDL